MRETHYELLTNVEKTYISNSIERKFIKPKHLIKEFKVAGYKEIKDSNFGKLKEIGFEGIEDKESTSIDERAVMSNEKNNLQPYWGYKRCDLIAYANAINIKPLFLFPNELKENDKAIEKQDEPHIDSEINSDISGFSEKDNEKLEFTRFIKEIIKKYPEATSKDFVSHCFECYKDNNRKLTKIKKIIKKLGIVQGGRGRRTKEAFNYFKEARKYKPTQ